MFNELKFENRADGPFSLGVQARIKFDNGYGASVVRGPYTYGGPDGLYELAVIGPDGRLDYSTPVTNDVEGYCSKDKISELLAQIKALPAKQSI